LRTKLNFLNLSPRHAVGAKEIAVGNEPLGDFKTSGARKHVEAHDYEERENCNWWILPSQERANRATREEQRADCPDDFVAENAKAIRGFHADVLKV
jgi:hypothetical protein